MYPTRSAFLAGRTTCLITFFTLVLLTIGILPIATYSHAIDSPDTTSIGRTVRVGIYETSPLAYTDIDGSAHGFFVKMLNHIAEKEQWNMQYVPGSWQEGLDRLKSDRIDMVLCIAYTEARDKDMDFPKEFLLLDWGLIFRGKGSDITSLLDLEGKKISILKGDVYSTGFKELGRLFNLKVKFQEVDQPNDVFKAVSSGEADAGVNGNLYGILHENSQSVEQTPIIFTPVKLGYAVNEGKNEDLIAALEWHIAVMKADKTSKYYHELDHLLGKKDPKIPREAYWGLVAVAAALLFAIAFIALLKQQVQAKTEHLEEEIAERKQAELRLAESEDLLSRAQNISHTGSWKLDLNTNSLIWSDEVYRIFGCEPQEFAATYQAFLDVVHPDDRAMVDGAYSRSLLEGTNGYEIEHRIVRWNSGEIRHVHERCTHERDEKGSVIRSTGMVQDITDRKQAEESFRESQQFNKQIVRSVKEGIIVYGPDLRYQAWNPFMEQMTGVPASEVLGKYPLEVFPFLQEIGGIERLKKALSGEHVSAIEFPFWVQNSEKSGWASDNSTSFHNELGEIVGVIGIVNDITESKILEEEQQSLQDQLQQSQKMEAIGTLAGGIAHDFNNILGAILGYAEMAQDDSPTGSILRKNIDQIVNASHRARELVKQILAFSRQAESDHMPLQPAFIVKEVIKMLRSALPSTIDIKQNIDMEAGLILASPTQIHQIVMNLGTNAFHAMEETGGTLAISLKRKSLNEKDIIGKQGVAAGDFIQLSVADNGIGIAPELWGKIFNPYFTTKEVGKGTGMGLAIIHGIVKSYGGWISFQSLPGKGTVFQVLLPVMAKETMVENEPEAVVQSGNERILFVDDDEILAEMGKKMLERLGYRVTVQSSSLKALTTFQNYPDEFDLVITDQTMPGMTGSNLAQHILQIRPQMPIILCTGYSSIITKEMAKFLGIKGFAMKPIDKKKITELIREVLC